MVRYTVQAEDAPQLDGGDRAPVRRWSTASRPAGVRYWYGRLPDGATYVALLELDDGVDNPLPRPARGSAISGGAATLRGGRRCRSR